MISNKQKSKLIASFNNVVTSVHNLRADIAAEGKKAFTECNTQDINELMQLLGKINEIAAKVDKAAPVFRSYSLDIATETHPAEFSNSGVQAKEVINEYPVNCYIEHEGTRFNITINATNKYALKAPCVVTFDKTKLNKTNTKRIANLLSLKLISIVDDCENTQVIKVNEDVEFTSANALTSFILNKNVVNGEDLILLADGLTLKEHTLEKYLE